jgi:putative intracellular protease/amidase
MTRQPLSGKKIAVLVESEYIPDEIRTYRERFADYGAAVDLVSRLWGQQSLQFYSTVNPDDNQIEVEKLEVSLDVDHVDLEGYAAVIMAANYSSVRLRFTDPPTSGDRAAEAARNAPAVRLFRRAMQNPSIIKGAPCHALWLLTPSPELLAGRKVTCNPVVLADVVNAGAIYVPAEVGMEWDRHVVVDDDLVTSASYRSSDLLVDAVRDAILGAEARGVTRAGATEPATVWPSQMESQGRRRILVGLSGKGYWGEELIGPLDIFDDVGYITEFFTPDGSRPVALPPSYDPDYVDPALSRPVTSAEVARRVREIDHTGEDRHERSKRLDNPIDLRNLMPQRPYVSHPAYVHVIEKYYAARADAWRGLDRFDALLLVGGSGPVIDMVNNQRVHDLILGFLAVNKLVAAECYAIGCLAFAREIQSRESIIKGRRVTGHCLEYDYQTTWGWIDYETGAPPYPQEYLLRDAVGEEGEFIGGFGSQISTVVDYPFITGRSTSDGYPVGQAIVDVLEHNLRRRGW